MRSKETMTQSREESKDDLSGGSRRTEKRLAWAASMDLVQNRRKLEMSEVLIYGWEGYQMRGSKISRIGNFLRFMNLTCT